MFVKALLGGPLQTVGYLAYDREDGSAIVVDTPFGTATQYIKLLDKHNLRLLYVVNTHGHWDHIADNVALTTARDAVLCAHSWDAARLANPTIAVEDEDFAKLIQPSRPDMNLQEDSVLEVGQCRLRVLHTPGHTPGSICLHESEQKILFTGDTLYRMGVGRADMPGSNQRQLAQSLARLAALPDSTRIYPGHGLPSTIGQERWLLELALA